MDADKHDFHEGQKMTTPAANDTLLALLLAFLAGWMGELFSQLVLILGLSFLGALISLSRAPTKAFWPDGAIVLGRGMGLAVGLGIAGSALVAKLFGDVPFIEGMAAMSLLVGLRTEWFLAKFDAWGDR